MNKQVWGLLSYCLGCTCGMLAGKNFCAGNIGAGLAWGFGSFCTFLILSLIYQHVEMRSGE